MSGAQPAATVNGQIIEVGDRWIVWSTQVCSVADLNIFIEVN